MRIGAKENSMAMRTNINIINLMTGLMQVLPDFLQYVL
ncbi:Uncharacterised protein [Salmonella enterica subsp. enterica]|nr:Uncharacterised protein [Salmonella enterica subsp. enterica]